MRGTQDRAAVGTCQRRLNRTRTARAGTHRGVPLLLGLLVVLAPVLRLAPVSPLLLVGVAHSATGTTACAASSTVTIPAGAGWNLVGGAPLTLWPDATSTWAWNAVTGQWYRPSGSEACGTGSWEYVSTAGPRSVNVEACSGPLSLAVVVHRWNLVGNPCSTSVTVPSTARAYWYDPSRSRYVLVTTIGAGAAAWVKPDASPLILSPSSIGSLPGNPPNTSSNVHLAMGSNSGVNNCCDSLLSTTPPIDTVWNWSNGTASSYPTIYKGFYYPDDRQPDSRWTPNAEPLSWFQTNHPDWIEYQCDQKTIAYEFGDTTAIPLDTANPAVLAWEEQTFWGPTAASGTYQMLAFDNFQFDNSGNWSGQRCGHFDTAGTWVQQYNGTSNDPNYRQAEINLASALRSWLHSQYPSVAFSPNFSYDDGYPAQSDQLMSQADVLLEESGWTNGCYSSCQYLDSAWTDKAQHLSSFLAAGHGWIDQNHEPVNGTKTTSAQRQWAIGNYLMFKNSASWMFIDGPTDGGQLVSLPEYAAAQVGTPTDTYYANQGVYRRDFTSGLVFVNPSSTSSYTVSIPANTYKDLYGTVQGGSITLATGSAIILVHV